MSDTERITSITNHYEIELGNGNVYRRQSPTIWDCQYLGNDEIGEYHCWQGIRCKDRAAVLERLFQDTIANRRPHDG